MPCPDQNKLLEQRNQYLDNTSITFTQCTEPLCLQRCVVAEGKSELLKMICRRRSGKTGTMCMHDCEERGLHKESHKGKLWDWSGQETMVA